MRLFPRHYKLQSEKNGVIEVVEWLWWANMYAGGFEQSGPYVIGLWRNAMRRIRHAPHVEKILILGMGLGDSIRIAETYFPNAKFTIVEWDQAVINLALRLHRFKTAPDVIHADLRDALPTLAGSFDVILSDAFYGDQPDVGADTAVGNALTRLLAPSGTCLLNASRTPSAIEYMAHFLHLEKTWLFRENTIAKFIQK